MTATRCQSLSGSPLAIRIGVRSCGALRIVDHGVSRQIIPAADSAHVGYVFVAPGRREHFYYGVMTYTDLTEAARAFLNGR